MICHYEETLLCLKLPLHFSCDTWQNKDFINLGTSKITLIYGTTALMGALILPPKDYAF